MERVEYVIYALPQEPGWFEFTQVATAIAAIIVAVIALAFSIIQVRINQRHNRLSVRPHIEAVKTYDEESKKFELFIENNGLGPAIIVAVHSTVDGEACPDGRDPVKWMFATLASNTLPQPVRLDEVVPHCAMRPGEKYLLFGFQAEDQADWMRNLASITDRCTITIKYTSAYGYGTPKLDKSELFMYNFRSR